MSQLRGHCVPFCPKRVTSSYNTPTHKQGRPVSRETGRLAYTAVSRLSGLLPKRRKRPPERVIRGDFPIGGRHRAAQHVLRRCISRRRRDLDEKVPALDRIAVAVVVERRDSAGVAEAYPSTQSAARRRDASHSSNDAST